jgi:hypothetical protein
MKRDVIHVTNGDLPAAVFYARKADSALITLAPGVYDTDQPIAWDGFRPLTITHAQDPFPGIDAGVTIRQLDGQHRLFGSNGGRALRLRGLRLVGANTAVRPLPTDYYAHDWVSANCGPDHVAVDVDYAPGTGSARTIVEDCSIEGFTTGLRFGASADPNTLNGSEGRLAGNYVTDCYYGVSFGQHQSKAWQITDNHVAGCHTLWTNRTHGLGLGYLSPIRGGSGGLCVLAFDHVASKSPLHVSDWFCENVLQLLVSSGGGSAQQPTTLARCHVGLVAHADTDWHLTVNRAQWFGGTVAHSEPDSGHLLRLNVAGSIMFSGVHFNDRRDVGMPAGPALAPIGNSGRVIAQNCSFRDSEAAGGARLWDQ